MKKIWVASLFFVAALSARADLIWYESFAYENGPIIYTGTNTDGTTNWFRHSGSANPSDAIVADHKLQNSATGGTVSRTDDVNRKLATVPDSPYTNSPIVVYASFTANCTNVPTATGYFAHFLFNNTNFSARVFATPGTLPSTWRLGVSAVSGTMNKVFPVDLAANTDYQVVLGWDPVNLFAATLWVDPISEADVSVMTADAVSNPLRAHAFGFRQAGSFGSTFFNITNLAVATTFDEAATSVWSRDPVNPVVAYSPKDQTNVVGDPVMLSAVAAGQSLANLTYQWRKNGANIANSNGNTNVFSIASGAVSDTGSYDLVVTTPGGLSATSAMAFLWVTNPPVPPTITLQPTNKNVYFGQTATFYVAATGYSPSYQWYHNGAAIPGETSPTLVVANVQSDNDTLGTYRCDVSNTFGTTPSAEAVLTGSAPPAATIGYLRTLVDPVFFLPTNTSSLWTVTGIVTTHTNVTTAANSSFYMQDDTGGICVFFGANTDARPEAGDAVTVSGPLGQYGSLLEMNLTSADPAHRVVTNSHNNPLPAGIVLPLSFTNSPAFGGASNAIIRYQGSVVTLTNVYFAAADGTAVFASGQNYTITNQEGEAFAFRVDSRVGDIIGKLIPSFAWTVTGPMGYYLGATAPNRSSGFQILPTLYSDIVTEAPPAVTVSASNDQGKPTLTWLAQPYMSYSIYRATSVTGPYVPLATGLTFNSTAGRYTDTSTSPDTRFYKVASP
ncbi:MAG TPA: immunoglobulin domain-containing protein [Verrucomicrobiae bacterium]